MFISNTFISSTGVQSEISYFVQSLKTSTYKTIHNAVWKMLVCLVINSANTQGELHALAIRCWPEGLLVEFGIPSKGHLVQFCASVS